MIFATVVAGFWALHLLQIFVNLKLIPRLDPGARAPDSAGLVSVIIPARDEALHIGHTVRAMLAQTWRNLEVIVVDDRSSDGTGDIVAQLAAEDPRLRLVRGDEPPAGWLGKPNALAQGARHAKGRFLLFADADIVYAPAAVESLLELALRTGARFLSPFPGLVMRGFWENVFMPQLAMAAFGLLPSWLANRTRRFPILAIGGGPGMLIARDDYDAIGGHTRLRNAIIDDVGLARLARRSGLQTIVARGEELITVRMYAGGRAIIDGFTKNMYAALGGSLAGVFLMIAFAVAFHLMPYVWGAMAIAALASGDAIPSSVLIGSGALVGLTIGRVVLFAKLRYSLLSAVFAYPLSVLAGILVTLRSAWHSGVRGRTSWRGRTYVETTSFGE